MVPYIIAEIGINHEGKIQRAIKLIKEAKARKRSAKQSGREQRKTRRHGARHGAAQWLSPRRDLITCRDMAELT